MAKSARKWLGLFVIASAGFAAASRGVTPEDYYRISSVTDARISPRGDLAAYVVTSADAKQNKRLTSIWVAPLSGPGAPRLFANDARAPRWSPDGNSLGFLAVRAAGGAKPAAKTQVYVQAVAGVEARRLTEFEDGVDTFQWSPDGARLVCVSKTGPKRRSFADGGSDVRHYFSLTYKFNDSGWYDERRAHLFIVDVAGGPARQITSGDQRNDSDPQWSPDGARIAFSSEDTTRSLSAAGDVWVAPADGGPAVRVNPATGSVRMPRWSPDGKNIAFAASPTEGDMPRVFVASADGGKPRLVSKDLDLAPSEMRWVSRGGIYFDAVVKGQTHLFRLNPDTGALAQLTAGERAVRNADYSAVGERMVYASSDFRHPDDLFAADLDGAHERRLTTVARGVLDELDLQGVERIPYAAADGVTIDGFFVKPMGWVAGKSYPMILSIHGGPAGMYGVDWFQEAQVYAARGWAVFFANPRGSTGYGNRFQRAVELNWGGKAYTDLMSGVDAALAKYPWIDKSRLGVTGGSYGGFMTNWIISHTNRFRAAVTLRSISDFVSVDGTRDGAYGHAQDFGGDLFQNFQAYWDTSPLKYAANVKTPTLVMHSDNDNRVPLEQGEQWFRALKHFGVTAEFVIFPRENHNLTRTGEPRHLVESLNWQVYWFDRFLNGNEAAIPPDKR